MGLLTYLFGQSPLPEVPKPQRVQANGTTQSPRTSRTSDPLPGVPGYPARSYYEALNLSDDRSIIPIYSFALRHVIRSFNRDRLGMLAEYLYDNDGTVALAVDTIANYSVPIAPMAASVSSDWNKVADEFFRNWGKRADFTGRFDFDSLQRIMCIGMDTVGEAAPLVTEENGLPQIQLIDPTRINSTSITDPKIKHVDGVGVTEKGQVIGYWVRPDVGAPPEFFDANSMMLIYDPERSREYRGMSPARRGMNDIRDAKDIKGFEKLATKISSALAAVLEGADSEDPDVWGTATGNEQVDSSGNVTSAATIPGNEPDSDATPEESNISMASLLGGDIPVMPKGQKLHQLDNNRPGDRVIDMLEYLAGCYVSGLGVPPAFIVHRGNTGPAERSVNGKAQRKFNSRQVVMARFVEWVWVRVIGWGIATNQLPSQEGWEKMEWQGPPKVSIDDGRDAQQWREDVLSGLRTRQECYGNRSLGWLRETDQGFIEDDYIIGKAADIAKRYRIPIEWILSKWGYTIAKPAPAAGADKKEEQNTEPKKSNENSSPSK
jgi:hypothetical protein